MWGEFDDNAFSNLSDTSSNEERKTTPKENDNYDDLRQTGFKTASGKLLKPVSEEAVKRARALLSEPTHDPLDNQEFSGFKTASGKELKPVSEEAMIKAQSLLNEAVDEQSVDHKLDKQEFSGFKTASGKQLRPVSPAALEKAKALLAEKVEDVSLTKETDEKAHRINTMFTTASGKTLTAVKKETEKWSTTLIETQENSVKRPLETIENIPVKGGLQDISNVKRQKKSTLGKRNKPFKSPIIRSNIELTKAAIGNKNKSRTKGESVFDLTAPNQRKKMSSLGKPQQYTRKQLLSKNISLDILDMTSSTARKYTFDNGTWGPKQAQRELIKVGALPSLLSFSWVENHYGWIVWKMACQIRSYPDIFISDWNPERVMHQLRYRYEREINQGHRPVLKKILEQDDIAAKHMILVISNITEIKDNTTSKYRLQLTDGWYQISAYTDLRMEHAVTKKKLKVGHKLSICGAQLVSNRTDQSADEAGEDRIISISSNGCLPVAWDAQLGYHPKKYIIRSLPRIFDDGGMVTALDIVVCRKFPMLYKETLPNRQTVNRTAKEEEEMRCGIVKAPNFFGAQNNRQINLEDRQVRGHFKIRICDYSTRLNQPWATLLLSNANELNHMDIAEGSRYKVFFVMPYNPTNKRYPGLHFKTTRMTRWEPTVSEKRPSYSPRCITSCLNVRQQDYFLDFDMVVLILQTSPAKLDLVHGRKLWRQRVLVTDQSQSICQIEARLPVQLPPQGCVIGLVNLRFELYDSKYDITCMKTTDETELVLKSSIDYINQGFKSLRAWTQTNPDTITSIKDKIHTIIH
ncbi:hypothetical protein G6F56_006142 [Rhizopus delemar]|nr:hypothetical protein G6F56_006142 [Rhizopus delemar]